MQLFPRPISHPNTSSYEQGGSFMRTKAFSTLGLALLILVGLALTPAAAQAGSVRIPTAIDASAVPHWPLMSPYWTQPALTFAPAFGRTPTTAGPSSSSLAATKACGRPTSPSGQQRITLTTAPLASTTSTPENAFVAPTLIQTVLVPSPTPPGFSSSEAPARAADRTMR